MTDTANAPERIWTADTTGNCSVGFNTPSLDYKNEYISRTHCDKLVAAAYLDAAQRIEQCLWSQHWYIDGESVDPEDLSEGITKRTPDDARAALTAYGERMKAEGASEAQAKIARLTEALKEIRDRHINPNNGFAGEHYAEVRRFAGAALQENANEKARVEGRLVIVDSPELAKLRADLAEAQTKIARLTEALAIAGPIALKVFDYHLFTLDAEDQRKVETIRAALQENANG